MRNLKKLAFLALGFAMIVSALCLPAAAASSAQSYTDVVPGHWAYEVVTQVTEKGLINGVGNGKFDPNGHLTQGQLATILARLDGQDTDNSNPWYEVGVTWAVQNGICDSSNPDAVLTRADVVEMLWRSCDSPAASADLSGFTDAQDVSDAVVWAVANGIMEGSNNALRLGDSVTRAEAAALLVRFLDAAGQSTNIYYKVANASEVNIEDDGIYTIRLLAEDGWMFDITDNMDVTAWLVKQDGTPAFADAAGIASTQLVYGPVAGEEDEVAVGCNVIIDASKISGFTEAGSYDLYVFPTGKETIWACGDNHGQYVDSMERAGRISRPELTVDGKFESTIAMGRFTFSNDTVQLVLAYNGKIDDSLIDDSKAVIYLGEGDGYYLDQIETDLGSLSGVWKNGATDYSMVSISTAWAELGGDGNGHYDFNIVVSGIKYNGLPLSDATVHTDFYCGGRTFETPGGSLILNTEPMWGAEADIPVLCDPYPDFFTITWPIGFDGSKVTAKDITVTMLSDYGATLTLDPTKDYVVESTANRTGIVLNYIYWANAPVYTELQVSVKTQNVTYNSLMYAPPAAFTHNYDIASVYATATMGGGSVRLEYLFFGLENLTDTHQVFKEATYTLTTTDANGNVRFYAEDANGNGILVDNEADAIAFSCDEECNVRFEGMRLIYDRLYDQTEDKTVDGKVITFDKRYWNPETLLRSPSELAEYGVKVARGYTLGSGWEDHLKWPWQTFINEGYQGGSK